MAAGLLQRTTLASGVDIGRYRIDRLIGRGGMGEVYAATEVATAGQVALKIIRSDNISDDQRRRFKREARAANAIDHEHVIKVLDVFDVDGAPVIVMELLLGESLASLMKRRLPLSLAEAAAILAPVASALRAAHDKGIVHRDLKPDNIFLARRPDGEVVPKVLDFGIAKVLDPDAILSTTAGGQTNTGSILGTPQYMSFEQAMSERDIDHTTDIWSFGVILFELLAGERPLSFDTLGQMYVLLLQGEVPSIRERLLDLPDEVAALVDRSLRKDRRERLGDIGAFSDALAPYVDAGTVLDVRGSAPIAVSADGATQIPVTATQAVDPRAPRLWQAGLAALVIAGGALGFARLSSLGGPADHASAPESAASPAAVQAVATATAEPRMSASASSETAPPEPVSTTAASSGTERVAPPPARREGVATPALTLRPTTQAPTVSPPPPPTSAAAPSAAPPTPESDNPFGRRRK